MESPSQGALDLDAVAAAAREGLPLVGALNLQFELATPERAIVKLPETPGIRRPGNVVSGPALFAMADLALWVLVLARTGEEMAVTTTLTMDFLAAARETPLIAEAVPLRFGRRSMVGTVHIREESTGRLIVHASGTYARPLD